MGKDLENLRHSTSHVMAIAVKKLFPDVKLGIGPAIEDGFYYDFDTKHVFTLEDMPKIEKVMKEVIAKNLAFEKKIVSYEEAKKILKNESYKLELLDDIKKSGEKISFYKTGDFIDLCEGPHVNSTREINAFKLLKIAGAYWKGDSKNKQLQRIYGTAFYSEKELKEYLHLLEEAEKRDHRKLGKLLELFSFSELSPGSAFFHPKGTIIYNELLAFLRLEYKKRGYSEVITPLLYDKSLWETSGHWQHFKENMFTLKVDNRDFALKPMNCPSHILIYKTRLRSYKELPLRLADFAPLHRNEVRGTLGGLTRVRKLSQDDAHIFCTEQQLEDEILNELSFVKYIYNDVFKMEYSVSLSTKPEKSMGDQKLWDKAENALRKALEKKKIKYNTKEKEGSFYGPKIDFDVKDALGRTWQLATVQLDFQMPLKFEATYEGEDGRKHTPIMIHRAILGSLERFIGVLIEHYAGKFPLWLSPVQVKILTLTDRNIKFAKSLKEELESNGIRTGLDDRLESMPRKVRDAQLEHVNYMVTIGDKEEQNNTVAIRTLDGKVKFGVKVKTFIIDIKKEIEEKL